VRQAVVRSKPRCTGDSSHPPAPQLAFQAACRRVNLPSATLASAGAAIHSTVCAPPLVSDTQASVQLDDVTTFSSKVCRTLRNTHAGKPETLRVKVSTRKFWYRPEWIRVVQQLPDPQVQAEHTGCRQSTESCGFTHSTFGAPEPQCLPELRCIEALTNISCSRKTVSDTDMLDHIQVRLHPRRHCHVAHGRACMYSYMHALGAQLSQPATFCARTRTCTAAQRYMDQKRTSPCTAAPACATAATPLQQRSSAWHAVPRTGAWTSSFGRQHVHACVGSMCPSALSGRVQSSARRERGMHGPMHAPVCSPLMQHGGESPSAHACQCGGAACRVWLQGQVERAQ
jgi:hypothetical protein